MLTEMIRRCSTDDDGSILLKRDVLVGALEGIRDDHRREMQILPEVAGRLVAVMS